jgi:hypothetical protein
VYVGVQHAGSPSVVVQMSSFGQLWTIPCNQKYKKCRHEKMNAMTPAHHTFDFAERDVAFLVLRWYKESSGFNLNLETMNVPLEKYRQHPPSKGGPL